MYSMLYTKQDIKPSTRENGTIKRHGHGHGKQCYDCWGKGGTRGLNSNGKNTIRIKSKTRERDVVNTGWLRLLPV